MHQHWVLQHTLSKHVNEPFYQPPLKSQFARKFRGQREIRGWTVSSAVGCVAEHLLFCCISTEQGRDAFECGDVRLDKGGCARSKWPVSGPLSQH